MLYLAFFCTFASGFKCVVIIFVLVKIWLSKIIVYYFIYKQPPVIGSCFSYLYKQHSV
nr:MAG TPA: hypothetical protein [Siphoviridae sp. ctgbm9]